MSASLEPGASGDAVTAVQRMLIALGYRQVVETRAGLRSKEIVADGAFGPQTEEVVMDFQRDEGLLVDGVVGPRTMAALQAAFARRQLELHAPGTDALGDAALNLAASDLRGAAAVSLASDGTAARLPFVRVPADKVPGYDGYDGMQLRADVAAAYTAARDELRALGGVVTSAGGKRALDAAVGEGRSATSMHYLGRAFDMSIYSGMVDPARDPYVVEMPPKGHEALDWRAGIARKSNDAARTAIEGGTSKPGKWHWVVWARLPEAPAAAAKHLEFRDTVAAPVTYRERRGTKDLEVKGPFVNLTKLLAHHGFSPIQARSAFFTLNGGMINAEWWHFQYEGGLVPGVTTFGHELLRVYSEATLAGTPPWGHRHKIYGREWG